MKQILIPALLLNAAGIVFIHSATAGVDGFPSDAAGHQIARSILGLAGCFLVFRFDYRLLERHAYLIYAGLCAVLAFMALVRIANPGGTYRHLALHKFQLQPSELMKLALVIGLARYLRFRHDQASFRGIVAPFALTLVPMLLVLLQPDLGTSLLLPPILLAMLFVAGSRPRHLVAAILLGLSLLPAAYFYGDSIPGVAGYQHDRIKAYVQRDEKTLLREGFHLRQSLIAIGSGGLAGKGWCEGTQNTLGHLREKETDFIYGVIAEESGFIGSAAIVILFVLLIRGIAMAGLACREPFGRLMAAGIAAGIAAQAFENIGMTMGLTPITGVPLPFVSLGGSSLLASWLAIGLSCQIASRRIMVLASRDLAPSGKTSPAVLLQERSSALLESRWPVG